MYIIAVLHDWCIIFAQASLVYEQKISPRVAKRFRFRFVEIFWRCTDELYARFGFLYTPKYVRNVPFPAYVRGSRENISLYRYNG